MVKDLLKLSVVLSLCTICVELDLRAANDQWCPVNDGATWWLNQDPDPDNKNPVLLPEYAAVHPLAVVTFPQYKGRTLANDALGYTSLLPDVQEELKRLGFVSFDEDHIIFSRKLSISYVIHSAVLSADTDISPLWRLGSTMAWEGDAWYCRAVGAENSQLKNQAAVKFLTLQRPWHVEFALAADQPIQIGSSSLWVRSLPNGWVLRNFPCTEDTERWFSLQAPKESEEGVVSFCAFVVPRMTLDSEDPVYVSVEIILLRALENIDEIEQLLGVYSDPNNVCYKKIEKGNRGSSIPRSPSMTFIRSVRPAGPSAQASGSALPSEMQVPSTGRFYEDFLSRVGRRLSAECDPSYYGGARTVDFSFPSLWNDLKNVLKKLRVQEENLAIDATGMATIDPSHPIALEDLNAIVNYFYFIDPDHSIFIPDHRGATTAEGQPNQEFLARRQKAEAKLGQLWDLCSMPKQRGKEALFSFYIKNRSEPDIDNPSHWKKLEISEGNRSSEYPVIRELFLKMVRNFSGLQRVLSMLILHVLNQHQSPDVHFCKDCTHFDIYFSGPYQDSRSSCFLPSRNKVLMTEKIDFEHPQRNLGTLRDIPEVLSHDIPDVLFHELSHACHKMVLGRISLIDLSANVNFSIFSDPMIDFPSLFYPMFKPERMAPVVENLAKKIQRLGDLSYLKERILATIVFLHKQGMDPLLMRLLSSESRTLFADINSSDGRKKDAAKAKFAQGLRGPSGDLCKDIAVICYVASTCFDIDKRTDPISGKMRWWHRGDHRIEQEISIWCDPEEMFTMIGLVPLQISQSSGCVRYVIVDRQNHNAFRRRDGRATALYHLWLKTNESSVLRNLNLLLLRDSDEYPSGRESNSTATLGLEPLLPLFDLQYDSFPGLTEEMFDAGGDDWLFRVCFSALKGKDFGTFSRITNLYQERRREGSFRSFSQKKDWYSNTPLHIAAGENDLEAVKALSEQIAACNPDMFQARNTAGFFPAALTSDVEVLKTIIGAIRRCSRWQNEENFFRDFSELLRQYCHYHVDYGVDAPNVLVAFKYLLEDCGLSKVINLTVDGETPLIHAIRTHKRYFMQLLLEHGANITAEVLREASAEKNDGGCLKFLLEHITENHPKGKQSLPTLCQASDEHLLSVFMANIMTSLWKSSGRVLQANDISEIKSIIEIFLDKGNPSLNDERVDLYPTLLPFWGEKESMLLGCYPWMKEGRFSLLSAMKYYLVTLNELIREEQPINQARYYPCLGLVVWSIGEFQKKGAKLSRRLENRRVVLIADLNDSAYRELGELLDRANASLTGWQRIKRIDESLLRTLSDKDIRELTLEQMTARDGQFNTPLHLAVQMNDVTMVGKFSRWALDNKHPELFVAKNAAGELPLGVVSEIGVAKTMISFIRQCPPWDDPAHYVKNFGEVLFSHLGHHDILQYLLTDSQNPQEGGGLKAAINTLNSKGYTLLKHATELSKERAEQTIKLLLSCSADPTIRDGYGKTVLEQAVMSYPGISEEISNIVIQHAKEKGILQKWLENKSELNSLSTRKTVLDERRRHLAEVVRDILQKEPTDRTNDVNELRQDIWLIEQFLSHGAKLSNGWKLIEDPRDPHYKKLGEFLVKARRLLNTLSSPNPVLEDGFVEATRSLWEDLARCGG